MPIFVSRLVGGTHPRGHLHRLNVRIFNRRSNRWNSTFAAFEKDRPNSLIRDTFAQNLGLAGPTVSVKIQLFEYHATRGSAEHTTDIPLHLQVADDVGFRNYNEAGPIRVNLVLGKQFTDLLKDLQPLQSGYRLEFDNLIIKCVPYDL